MKAANSEWIVARMTPAKWGEIRERRSRMSFRLR
jgi:hypothetical protein